MSDHNNHKYRGILRRYLLLLPVLALGLLGIIGSGGGPVVQPTPIDWWTGAAHGTLYGRFALQNSTEGPPTAACNGARVPPLDEPADWWAALGTNITGGADAVGYTVWSDERPGCSRAMQTVYRSVMMFDISGLYSAAPTNTQLAGLLATAELEFSVIEQPSTNPLGWSCYSYTGGVGQLSTLRPGATVTAGLTNVGAVAGPNVRDNVIAAFPQPGTSLSDLWNIVGPGMRGRVTTTDTGPGIHAFRVDVKDVLQGAINNSRQELGFTVQSVGETEIPLTSDVQFACRTFVQPHRLHVTHW